MSALAFVLFFPVFVLIGIVYTTFPRQPRGAVRVAADLGVLILAAALSLAAMRWGFRTATGAGGAIWPQVLAALFAYGAFLATIVIALPLRALWLRRSRSRALGSGR